MLYQVTVEVPANTPKDQAVEKEVTVKEEVLTQVIIKFPPGPCGLLKVAIFYGNLQIWPSTEGEWASGDDETLESSIWFNLGPGEKKVKIKAYNEDELYEHSAIVRLEALPKTIAFWHLTVAKATSALASLFQKLWGRPL